MRTCRRAQVSLRSIEEAIGDHHLRLLHREVRNAAALFAAEVRWFQEKVGQGSG